MPLKPEQISNINRFEVKKPSSMPAKYCCRIFFIFLLCFNLALNSYSQLSTEQIRFRHLTSDDGLSVNGLYCILQDKNGFMWFGTEAGLCRYDGYSFVTYKFDSGDSTVSDNIVFCIEEDDEGDIWCGNRRQGTFVFAPRQGKFINRYKYNEEDSTSLNNNDVRAICKDNDGDIWIGTGRGINRYDKKTDKFIQYNGDENKTYLFNLFDLYVSKDGTLWIASHDWGGGLTSFNKQTKKFKQYIPNANDDNSLCYPHVVTIGEDKEGMLWIGTRSGLNYFNPKTENWKRFFNDSKNPNSISGNDYFLSAIRTDAYNNVWIGTYEHGLNIFPSSQEKSNGETSFMRIQHNRNIPSSLSNDNIRGICEDKSGLVWVATTGGLNIYDPRKHSFSIYQSVLNQTSATLNGNHISAIFQDRKGNFWIGVQGEGIDVFDKSFVKLSNYHHIPDNISSLSSNDITAIGEDDNGAIWITTSSAGVNKIENGHVQRVPAPTQPWTNCIYKDKAGMIWIGANDPAATSYDIKAKKNLQSFSENKEDTSSWGLKYTSAILEDSHENFWVASANSGLTLVNRNTNKFIHYKNIPGDNNSISHNMVHTIFEDSNGILWIGTIKGLNALDLQTNKIKRYYEQDGLSSDIILAIQEDKNSNLWVATSKGLCLFNPEKNLFRTYDVTDGLPSNEFTGAAFNAKDGKLFFGTVNGLVAFYPENLKDNAHKPPVVITKLTVLNKPWTLPQNISYTKEITFSYLEYFFTFEFAALDFAAPGKNQYAYKMDGFNKEWVYLGNKREVTFTNLDHGEYIFKVKGSNNHGYWNEEGTSVKIIITPPWWKTKTFYASCVITLILIIYGYIKWRERKLQMEKKILEEKVETRTLQLRQEKEKVQWQKNLIEEKQKEIIDSINYAKRLQEAILPPLDLIKKHLPDSFLLYKPKDIVAGDFYWMEVKDNTVFIAAADSTGHGVPGAMMSVVCSNALNRAVKEFGLRDTGKILDKVTDLVLETFEMSGENVKDGMDISLLSLMFNPEYQGQGSQSSKLVEIQWSGANNPLWYIQNGELIEIKPNKQPIGKCDNRKPFTTHTISPSPTLPPTGGEEGRSPGAGTPFPSGRVGDGLTFYLFTDGFQDQFGGPKEKKFLSKRFEKNLSTICHLPLNEQQETLQKAFTEWKGSLEQVDDVTVIGVRV